MDRDPLGKAFDEAYAMFRIAGQHRARAAELRAQGWSPTYQSDLYRIDDLVDQAEALEETAAAQLHTASRDYVLRQLHAGARSSSSRVVSQLGEVRVEAGTRSTAEKDVRQYPGPKSDLRPASHVRAAALGPWRAGLEALVRDPDFMHDGPPAVSASRLDLEQRILDRGARQADDRVGKRFQGLVGDVVSAARPAANPGSATARTASAAATATAGMRLSSPTRGRTSGSPRPVLQPDGRPTGRSAGFSRSVGGWGGAQG